MALAKVWYSPKYGTSSRTACRWRSSSCCERRNGYVGTGRSTEGPLPPAPSAEGGADCVSNAPTVPCSAAHTASMAGEPYGSVAAARAGRTAGLSSYLVARTAVGSIVFAAAAGVST